MLLVGLGNRIDGHRRSKSAGYEPIFLFENAKFYKKITLVITFSQRRVYRDDNLIEQYIYSQFINLRRNWADDELFYGRESGDGDDDDDAGGSATDRLDRWPTKATACVFDALDSCLFCVAGWYGAASACAHLAARPHPEGTFPI